MTQDCVWLLRLNKEVCQLWGDALAGDVAGVKPDLAEAALNAFAATIKQIEIPKGRLLCSPEIDSDFTKKLAESIGAENLAFAPELKAIRQLLKQQKNVAYLPSPAPLLDLTVSQKLFDMHQLYEADYSYGENLPPGVSPVFFGVSLFEAMAIETDDDIPDELPVPLSQHVEKNINKFHVEIHFEMPDLRMLRLDFSTTSRRSLLQSCRISDAIDTNKAAYAQLEGAFEKKPELLVELPSYLEVELISDCEYKCIFCPRQYNETPSHKLETKDLDTILSWLDNALGDTTIALGGLGEPTQHGDCAAMAEKLLSHDAVKHLIIETNGFRLDALSKLAKHKQFDKLRLVINLNSLKNYGELHGVDNAWGEKVKEHIASWAAQVKENAPASLVNTYVQVLKIQENELEVDELFDFTDALGISFLLQKYNRYVDLMPERRVSDMTPLERSFCWHLRRDLFIRANGDVSFCKQDFANAHVRGNINKEGLDTIWQAQQKDWQANYSEKYPKKPDCANCDEYFTFNM